MKKEDIHLWDVHRILFGEAPAEFMIEVFIRTLLIYLALLTIVRLMGKRMSGQLTIAEMSVMLTLGAIVSPAMQIPNVGLAQGTLILILAFIFQRGLNFLEFKNYKLEKLSHGEIVLLVKDGTLILEEMDKAKLSRQQLFAVLRSEGIFNLGQIERVYLEAFGMFSIYKTKNPKPGLPIFPPEDEEIKSFSKEAEKHEMVCKSCGHIGTEEEFQRECSVCLTTEWIEATLPIK
ncbi:DUF421 domain-containing protein [Dyadobacter psychrotolerans]|uniref:DUF421 domain-containing protein n=1 Tax=Dyadobacter psychrotolerans TaxID=2541721 RepID=A0A4V2Z3Y0_9BACT|nr:YetF domain-containing protein [Dyadobacter psychrotolerans]TDE14488.1 DUF421 domain-containing protein [Dyadobacter psychrotolerans]